MEDEGGGVLAAIGKGTLDMFGLGFAVDQAKKDAPWHKVQQAQFKNVQSEVGNLKETIKQLHDKTVEGGIQDNMKSIREVLGVINNDMDMTTDMMDNKISPIARMIHLIFLIVLALLIIILFCV